MRKPMTAVSPIISKFLSAVIFALIVSMFLSSRSLAQIDVDKTNSNIRHPKAQRAQQSLSTLEGLTLTATRSTSPAAPPLRLIHDFYIAIRSNDVQKLNKSLESTPGEIVNRPLRGGATPLHLASTLDNTNIVSILINHGADVNAETEGGFTPLHWAAGKNSINTVKLLLESGAKINASTPAGITPLHWAANNNATNVLLFLISAGADMEATTDSGLTPLHWAVKNNAGRAAATLAFNVVSTQIETQKELKKSMPDTPQQPISPISVSDSDYKSISPSAMSVSPETELVIPLGHGEALTFIWIPSLNLWVGKYEITNNQYRRFNSSHDSMFHERFSLNESDQPAVYISWYQAISFCEWLNKNLAEHFPRNTKARLPTDLEWTIFARCGDERKYPWGSDWPPPYGNYSDLSSKEALMTWTGIEEYKDGYVVTCPTQESGVNEWGIYGLAGNVWEWCVDWHDSSKTSKVRHGGCWDFDKKENLEINTRGFDLPDARYDTIGFRVVIAPN